jgi:hypothetical protein
MYYDYEIKEDGMGGVCSTHGCCVKCVQNLVIKPEGDTPM